MWFFSDSAMCCMYVICDNAVMQFFLKGFYHASNGPAKNPLLVYSLDLDLDSNFRSRVKDPVFGHLRQNPIFWTLYFLFIIISCSNHEVNIIII